MTWVLQKRPRNHRLEQESQHAFNGATPNTWVKRYQGQDYGIDAEVELFSGDNSTSIIFKVQLRATDDPSTPPKLKVSQDHVNYWLEFDVPVLVVRYVADSGQLFWAWAHDKIFSPPRDHPVKTFTVRFGEEHSSLNSTPDFLEAQVERWRERRRGDLDTPVTVYCALGELGDLEGEIRRGLLDAVSSSQGMVNLTTDPNLNRQAVATIDLDSTSVRLEIGASVSCMTFVPGSSIGFSVCVLLALGLFREGRQTTLAGIIAANAVIHTELARDPNLAIMLGDLLARTGHFDEVNQLMELCAIEDEVAGVAYQIQLMRHLGRTSAEIDSSILTERRKCIALEIEGNKFEAASRRYGMANLMRTSGRAEESLVEYEHAARLDPNYLKRSYWWRELGGARFLADRYEDSAIAYRTSVDLGDDAARIGLLDALMYSGQILQAKSIADSIIENGRHGVEEARIKSSLLNWFLARGLPMTNRMPIEAEKALDAGNIDEAIDYDLMCSEAWMFKAATCVKNDTDPMDDLCRALASDIGNTVVITMILFYGLIVNSEGAIGESRLDDIMTIARRSNNEVRELLISMAPDHRAQLLEFYDSHSAVCGLESSISLRFNVEGTVGPLAEAKFSSNRKRPRFR